MGQYVTSGRPHKKFCFSGDEGFVPNRFLEVLERSPKLQEATSIFKRSAVNNPYDRIMYHLFASQGFGAKYDGARLFDPATVVGHLYLKSLGNITQIPRDP